MGRITYFSWFLHLAFVVVVFLFLFCFVFQNLNTQSNMKKTCHIPDVHYSYPILSLDHNAISRNLI